MKVATVFLVFLGLSVAAIGGVFTWLLWDSYERASAMQDWPQVDGLVLSSEVEESKHDEFSPMEYSLKILYGYEWQGEAKTGDQYSARGSLRSKDPSRAADLVKKFPVGKVISVYVSPDDSNNTVLKPDSKAAGYSIWFPLLFVVGGMGIAIKALLPGRKAVS